MNYVKGYLRSYDEAFLIVHALRLGYISPIRKRLTQRERDEINTGNIYIFIENKTMMVRWTDGCTWSPSKILGPFLLYKEVPKHMTKNATMKQRDAKTSKPKCIPIEKQLQIDKLVMHKKTVSIAHAGDVYHIVAYFMPIFDRHSIMSFPFFRSLNKALTEHPELYDDEYVRNLKRAHVNISRRYGILEYTGANLVADINRKALEDDALYVLRHRFNVRKDAQKK